MSTGLQLLVDSHHPADDTDDPQLLYGTSPPLPPIKPHDVQPHPQKTIGNHP